MAIRRFTPQMSDIRPGRTKPRALDTLIIDKLLFPLTYRNGGFGYMRDGTFVPVDEKQLLKHPVPRGGSTTWFIKPQGRERVRLDPKKDTQ
jgi:hypothetical protein